MGTIGSIAAGIVAIAKAIPAFQKIIEQVLDLFTDWKIGQIEDSINNHQSKRKALINSIVRAESNEERKALSIMLADLNRSELSDS